MQLSIRHALQNIDNIDNVVILWDELRKFPLIENDLSDEYKKFLDISSFCKKGLESLPYDLEVYPLQNLEFTHDEILGWLRQQYAVFNLHNIWQDDAWIVLNSDVILRNKKIFKHSDEVIFYTDCFDYYEPYFHFINYATGLIKRSQPSYMGHFWFIERKVLESIESFLIKKHGKSIPQLFKDFHRPLLKTIYPWPTIPPLSECEFYGLYKTEILKEKIQTPKYNLISTNAKNFSRFYKSTIYDLTLDDNDDLPYEFCKENDIKINEDLAFALNYKNILR